MVATVRRKRLIRIQHFDAQMSIGSVITSPFIVNFHGEETEWVLQIDRDDGDYLPFCIIRLFPKKGKFPIYTKVSLDIIDEFDGRGRVCIAKSDDFEFYFAGYTWHQVLDKDLIRAIDITLELDLRIDGQRTFTGGLVPDKALEEFHVLLGRTFRLPY